MQWMLIFGATVFLALLLSSRRRAKHLRSEKLRNARRVLLVIAHPDDECMFFTPTLRELIEMGRDVSILCLSNGNFGGMGRVREKELVRSAEILGIPEKKVRVVDDERLQDGMDNVWDKKVVASYIREEVKTRKVEAILTFDEYGVSGHVNHRACCHGVKEVLRSQSTSNDLSAFSLESINIFRKYSSLFEIIPSVLLQQGDGGDDIFFSLAPQINMRLMYAHESQFVWFRKFFVAFSSYTFCNHIIEIGKPAAVEEDAKKRR